MKGHRTPLVQCQQGEFGKGTGVVDRFPPSIQSLLTILFLFANVSYLRYLLRLSHRVRLDDKEEGPFDNYAGGPCVASYTAVLKQA